MVTHKPHHRPPTARSLSLDTRLSMNRSGAGLVLAGAVMCTATSLTGCSVARPEARATALEVGQISGELAEVDVVIELRNPGEDEIELVQYDYTVSLGDGARYGGRWAALRALPPGQIVKARIPAVLPTASLDSGRTWSASGTLRYRDPSSVVRILYEAGLLKTEVGFSGSGISTTRPDAAASATPASSPSGE